MWDQIPAWGKIASGIAAILGLGALAFKLVEWYHAGVVKNQALKIEKLQATVKSNRNDSSIYERREVADFGIKVDECRKIDSPILDENTGKVRCQCQIRGTYETKPPEEHLVLVHRNLGDNRNYFPKPIDVTFHSNKRWEITYWQGGTGVKPVYVCLAGSTGLALIRYHRSIEIDERQPVVGPLGSDFVELGSGKVEIEAPE